MKLLVDTHTHTIASGHAYSSINEMIRAAKQIGLEMLAITEHAPAMPGSCHEFYFYNLRVLPRTYGELSLLFGTEVNILDATGALDLPVHLLQAMDLVVASIHPPCFDEPDDMQTVTDTYLQVMKNPYVDIIGHPDDSRFLPDYERLVRGAKETHTLLEINNSSMRIDSFRQGARENALEYLELCKKHNVMITTGSDAHVDLDVGNFQAVRDLLEMVDFPEHLIASTDAEKFRKAINRKRIR